MAILTEKTLLMDIEINTNDIPTMSTDLSSILADTTNILADTTNILADTTNILADTNSLVDQVGEVQASPTQYTLLERTKNIETNSSYGLTKPFVLHTNFVRPADTTVYTKGDIVAGNGVSVPYELDFSSFGAMANKRVIFQNLIIQTETTGTVFPIFFRTSTLGTQVFTDNSPFNPDWASYDLDMTYGSMGGLAGISTIASPNVYMNLQSTKNVMLNTDANSKIYFVFAVDTVFTPISAQKFDFTFKGTCYL